MRWVSLSELRESNWKKKSIRENLYQWKSKSQVMSKVVSLTTHLQTAFTLMVGFVDLSWTNLVTLEVLAPGIPDEFLDDFAVLHNIEAEEDDKFIPDDREVILDEVLSEASEPQTKKANL